MLAPIGPRFVSPPLSPRDSVEISVAEEAASLEDKLATTEFVEGEVPGQAEGKFVQDRLPRAVRRNSGRAV